MDTSRLTWYVARASGLVAWGLVVATILWGLVMATRVLRRRPRPAWLLDMHKFLGVLTLVFVGVHVTSILLDDFVHFGLADVLVPLASSWHPVAVACGIVGMYLLVAIQTTSWLRRHLSPTVWRTIHLTSYGVFAITTVHMLAAGTDVRPCSRPASRSSSASPQRCSARSPGRCARTRPRRSASNDSTVSSASHAAADPHRGARHDRESARRAG